MLKTHFKILGIAFVLLGLVFIGTVVLFNYVLVSGLPVERPTDFSLSVYEEGGMENESRSYELDHGHLVYRYRAEDVDETAEFDLSEEELEYLWDRLRVLRFDRIPATIEKDVSDHSSVTIHLSFDNININLVDAGLMSEDDSKRLYAVVEDVVYVTQPYLAARQLSTH